MQNLKINTVLPLTIIFFLCGCSHEPKSISDGRVTIAVPSDWKSSKASDGHILIEKNFIHPMFSDLHLATETISIKSRNTCISNEDMDHAKTNVERSLFGHRPPTSSWFMVTTRSASLSCLVNASPVIKGIPTDVMYCMSQDGINLIYTGESSMQPAAIEILKSMSTTVPCGIDQR